MTDGNMATQVSPIINDGEVHMLRDFFERFANTVVQASDFAKQVGTLRQELEAIRADGEALRQRNATLDAELYEVRQARDQARQERDEAKANAQSLSIELEQSKVKADMAEAESHSLQDALAAARKERDDAQFRVLELTEAKDKAESILADFRAKLGIPTPPVEVPAFLPGSQQLRVEPEQANDAEQKPTPQPDTPTEERVYRLTVGNGAFWNACDGFGQPDSHWDGDKGDYYYIKPRS